MDKIKGTVNMAKVNGAAQIVFKNRSKFPPVGIGSMLYVAANENKIYRYDKYKAEYVCIGTNPDGLQSQIDNIVIAGTGSGDAAAEVAQARVNASGTTFETLKARLDAVDVTDAKLKEDLNEVIEKNLITKNVFSEVKSGYIWSAVIGKKCELATGFMTPYIPIESGCDYSLNKSGHLCFFDADKLFISGSLTNQTYNGNTYGPTVSSPNNAKYAIVSGNDTTKNLYCLIKGNVAEELNAGQIGFKSIVFDESLSSPYSSISAAMARKLLLKNKVMLKDLELDHTCIFLYPNGEKKTVSGYFSTELIACKKKKYNIVGCGKAHICFYNSNKKFISATLCNQTYNDEVYGETFEVPENCEYFRISCTNISEDSGYIVETDYVSKAAYKYIVAKDGSGDFTTISDAIKAAKNDDIIYIRTGEYKETINLSNTQKVHLIGEDRLRTILYNTDGTYANPPITMGGGSLENMTVYAKQTEESHPGGDAGLAYAVHVERHSLSNDTLIIKDCILKSDFHAALGMGMRGGMDLLENVDFINEKTGAGLYIHDSDYDAYTGIQNITIRNCRVFINASNKKAVVFQSQEKSASMVNITLQSNYFDVSNNAGIKFTNYYNGTSTNPDDFGGLINWRKTRYSYGNNIESFNN